MEPKVRKMAMVMHKFNMYEHDQAADDLIIGILNPL